MKVASFNLENMFDRAKAMNNATWAEGKSALEAHSELNVLINQPVYDEATQRRILDLLDEQEILTKDEGPLLRIRKIRGKFVKRARDGTVTVEAAGRDDWIGWVELVTEAVEERATENTARVIATVNPDILGVIEAEDRTTLRLFNTAVMPAVQGAPYDHAMLIDGNDERGIDVGLLTRDPYAILSIRTNVDAVDAKGVIFSRDCAEYEIAMLDGVPMWVLVNHLKSKGYGRQGDNDARRLRQAQRVRELVDAHLAAGHERVVVLGDLNDKPDAKTLAPLLGSGTPLHDVATLATGYDDGGRPGTHGNCTAASKFDYILLSSALFARATAAGIERRGMWGGTKGTLWPHFPEVREAKDAASDHAAVWVELDV